MSLAPTPLTVAEARAILAANEALTRVGPDLLLGFLERPAWDRLVESARGRVAMWEGQRSV